MKEIEKIRAEVEEVRREHGHIDGEEVVEGDLCAAAECAYIWPCPALRLAEKYLKVAEALVPLLGAPWPDDLGLLIQAFGGTQERRDRAMELVTLWKQNREQAERVLAECAGDDATRHEPDPDAGILGHSPEEWERSTRRGEEEQ